MTPDIFKSISIICHDAGGANQILAMLRKFNIDSVNAYMEGPARRLWERAFPWIQLSNNFSEALNGTGTLISGTGWASDIEHDARKEALARGIHTIAVLDHWTNYLGRFVRNGETVLPDEIWVVDEYALEIAQQTFPSLNIKQQPGCYLDEQVSMILPLSERVGNELLYLLEPFRSNWGRDELGEFQALRYFLEQLRKLGLPENTVIRLRPHPSDSPGKYDEFLSIAAPHRVLLDVGDLSDALSRARWVAGCQTYAMILALKAGRTVYCSLPPWAPACMLPHDGLVHVKDLGCSCHAV